LSRVLRPWLLLSLAGGAFGIAGCGTLGYYSQAAIGQLDVLSSSTPVEQIIDDPATDEGLRAKLLALPEIRQFAVNELGLPDSNSFVGYLPLEREAMVWSVVAAPVDGLTPRQWCYPVVGCASYRGYFDEADAQAFAGQLAGQGWDVAVEPVPTYSTLGWFSDPLPSTVAAWPLPQIAGLMFHELAHEALYVPGDSAFNEAYATLIEQEGVRRWLLHRGRFAEQERQRQRERRKRDFLGLLRETQQSLADLYAQPLPGPEKLSAKAEVFAGLQTSYLELKQQWGGYGGYDRWFSRPLNNAHLAGVNTYHELMPAMRRLLARADGDFVRFQAMCRELAALSKDARHRRLGGLLP
jgi:predicted aminopeptidase